MKSEIQGLLCYCSDEVMDSVILTGFAGISLDFWNVELRGTTNRILGGRGHTERNYGLMMAVVRMER